MIAPDSDTVGGMKANGARIRTRLPPGVSGIPRRPAQPWFDELYSRYNRKDYLGTDPIQFLFRYPNVLDRELAALIASSFALGRVAHILVSVEKILAPMQPGPRSFLDGADARLLRSTYAGFKHRFFDSECLVAFLCGARNMLRLHGSLNSAFTKGLVPEEATVLPALERFASDLNIGCGSLIPSPARGSACKRLNLFLRWMVRRDDVDPGGWTGVDASKLIVPLDTHMFRMARKMGFTRRKSADLRTALEITAAFRRIRPDDPVRYDFALTRLGIAPGVCSPLP